MMIAVKDVACVESSTADRTRCETETAPSERSKPSALASNVLHRPSDGNMDLAL